MHTFDAGAVRHVHGVFHDPYRGGEWVLTGDRGEECALWFTPDGFRTLEPVVRGVQRARAVTVLPTPKALVVPMDSPVERNWIQLLDPGSGRLEPVAELPGSSFHSGRAGELLLVSTAVERSRVNTAQYAALFASLDGERWCEVARLERDLPLLRNAPPFFQWPTLALPAGTGSDEHVFATGQALRGLHGALLRFPVAEVASRLALPAAAPLRRAS